MEFPFYFPMNKLEGKKILGFQNRGFFSWRIEKWGSGFLHRMGGIIRH